MRHANPAESLIETMIAITVIVLATTAAMSVLRTATNGNDIIGKKIVAMNLAEEGFEALRNLRDTNYLLFSSDPDECWNKLNVTDVEECDDTSTAEITDSYTYYLTRSFTTDPFFKWTLARQTTTSQGYLTLFDLNLDGGSDWESQIYAQSTLTTGTTIASDTDNRRLFRRLITIDYPSSDYYNATITVTWTDHGETKTLSLTRSIANVY